MKRSEALEIIDTILFEHELPLLQGLDKEILGKLEKAGMLPPPVELQKMDSITNRYWELEDGSKDDPNFSWGNDE